jgi:dTDP-4-amino-4,6-dideoxygalactose transaminase
MHKRNFSTSILAQSEATHLLRERTGYKDIRLAGRGASAIWAALRALDLRDRPVLIPANTCYIVLWAILLSGNQPYLVDIDPLTGNITPHTLDRCAVANPAVLIPAHMYGIPADMPALVAWAKARNVFVLEDAALSTPEAVSHQSDAAVLSFGSGKIVDAGGGGALLTEDGMFAIEVGRLLDKLPLWKNRLQRLNDQWLEIYWALHQFDAANERLPELYPTLYNIYGEISLARLPSADWRGLQTALALANAEQQRRRDITALYDERFAKLAESAPIRLLPRPADAVLWRYPILVAREHRNALLSEIWASFDSDVTRWYPSLQPMLRALAPDLPALPTPAADAFADEIINLPLSISDDHALMNVASFQTYFDVHW